MPRSNIQHVTAVSFEDWCKVSSRNNASSLFLGKGIFSGDGGFWKYSRNLIKPLFARSEIADVESLSRFVDRLFNLIPRDGSTFDIQPLMHRLVPQKYCFRKLDHPLMFFVVS